MTRVSVEQHLNTAYRPDCDYVAGEVQERNLGEREHSRMQGRIFLYLRTHFPKAGEVLLEQRVQVREARFRVPDICVLRADSPDEQIIRTAPALCVEILSKDDTMDGMMERLQDYFDMGVPICWIVSACRREGWIASRGLLAEPADGILRAGSIAVPISPEA